MILFLVAVTGFVAPAPKRVHTKVNFIDTGALLPYAIVGSVVWWRTEKWYKGFVKKKDRFIEDYGRDIVRNSKTLDRPTRLREYRKTTAEYQRKLLYRWTDMLPGAGARKLVEAYDLQYDDLSFLTDYVACVNADLQGTIDMAVGKMGDAVDTHKMMFYTQRLDLDNGAARKHLLEFMEPNMIESEQKKFQEKTYAQVVRATSPPPYEMDMTLAAKLDIDQDQVEFITELINRPVKAKEVVEEEEEEWDPRKTGLQRLEAKDDTEELRQKAMQSSRRFKMINEECIQGQRMELLDKMHLVPKDAVQATCESCGYTLYIQRDKVDFYMPEDYTCKSCKAPREYFDFVDYVPRQARKSILDDDDD